MDAPTRRYRKRPLAVYEHGTRIYSPSTGEDRYRVVATDPAGRRTHHKFPTEESARARARELEAARVASGHYGALRDDVRTVEHLAHLYLGHLQNRSTRYRERQDGLLRRWILPQLGTTALSEWTPALSEEVLGRARQGLAPQTARSVGSCMRSLVTFAHKSRLLPKDLDPMWLVSYAVRPEQQGQAAGFIGRATLPNDRQCQDLFTALEALGEPTWALAMRLAHRSGTRWGELIALRPGDVEFEPYRVLKIHRAVEQSAKGRRIKPTKNTQQRSTIFPASLLSGLAEHVQRTRRDRGASALLFPGSDGPLAERRRFGRLWHRAAARAGWPMYHSHRAIWHPHDLRHVAACWMLFDLHLDPAHVARLLGHSNAAFTLAKYVGVRTGADEATDRLTSGW